MSGAVRPGDVRLVCGVPSLVLRVSDDGFTACPVKPVRDDADDDKVTGKVVFVSLSRAETGLPSLVEELELYDERPEAMNGSCMALPQFGAHIYDEDAGDLLFRIFPVELENAVKCYLKVFSDNDGKFDIEHENSEEDWGLYRRMCGHSMARFFAEEADAFILDENGNARPETDEERRRRLRRWRMAEARRKAGCAVKKA